MIQIFPNLPLSTLPTFFRTFNGTPWMPMPAESYPRYLQGFDAADHGSQDFQPNYSLWNSDRCPFWKKRKTLYPWAHGRSWEHDGVCCSKHQKWLNNAQQWRVALDRLAWTGHTGQLRSRLQALEGSDQQSGCLLVTNVRKNSTHRHLCSAGKGVGKP